MRPASASSNNRIRRWMASAFPPGRSDCFRLERPVAEWELHPLGITDFHGVQLFDPIERSANFLARID